MSALKPGDQRPSVNITSSWRGVPKNDRNLPITPDVKETPLAETHESPVHGVAMQKMAELPNKRGKGGRPTKAQQRSDGYMSTARQAIEDIRAENPPILGIVPHRSGKMDLQRAWEKEFDAREKELERAEAEAILSARKEQLSALEEETAIRRANRKVGVAAGMAAYRMVRTLGDVAEKLDKKVTETKDMSLSELRGTINTLSSSVTKMQTAMETVARLERTIARRPLEEPGSVSIEEEELANLSPEDAQKIIENILKTTYHAAQSAGIKVYDSTAEVVSEVTDEETES